MIKNRSLLAITLITSLCGANMVNAEEAETDKQYRYPSDLSHEEHAYMMNSSNKYDECLKKEAQKIINDHEDFRRIADIAMQKCAPVLTEIEKELAELNLDPSYVQFFVRKTSRNSARNILPQLMMMKAE